MSNFVQFQDGGVPRDPQFGGGANDASLSFLPSRDSVTVPGDFLQNPPGLGSLLGVTNQPTTPVEDWIEDVGTVRVMTAPELATRDANLLGIRKASINAEVATVGNRLLQQRDLLGITDHAAQIVAVQAFVSSLPNGAALDSLGFGDDTPGGVRAVENLFALQSPSRFVFGTAFQTTGVQSDATGSGFQHSSGAGVMQTPTNGSLTLAGPTGLYMVKAIGEWGYALVKEFRWQLLQGVTPVAEWTDVPTLVQGSGGVVAASALSLPFNVERPLALTNGDVLTMQFAPEDAAAAAGIRRYAIYLYKIE